MSECQKIECKNCHSSNIVKSGKVRNKQRYKCKECSFNFVEGDARSSEQIVALKALCVVLYSLSKSSYSILGKIFGRNRSLIYRWIKEAGLQTQEPSIDGDIQEIEFDEMWHLIGSKKRNFGSSKPLMLAMGKLLPGFSVIVILQHLDASTTK
jgi:transposase-like protein